MIELPFPTKNAALPKIHLFPHKKMAGKVTRNAGQSGPTSQSSRGSGWEGTWPTCRGGLRGSGKWQVAWFVNTNTGGVGKPPTGGKRSTTICFEVYHCQLISTQPAFQVFSQLDNYKFPPKKVCSLRKPTTSETKRKLRIRGTEGIFPRVFLRMIQVGK